MFYKIQLWSFEEFQNLFEAMNSFAKWVIGWMHNAWAPFHEQRLIGIWLSWISNHIICFLWDVITHPCLNLIWILSWMSNYLSTHLCRYMYLSITLSWFCENLLMLVKEVPDKKYFMTCMQLAGTNIHALLLRNESLHLFTCDIFPVCVNCEIHHNMTSAPG